MNINNEPQWHDIDVVGERSGQRYTGKVCIKPFLPHKEARDAQLLAEEYCGSIRNLDMIDFMTILAYVKFHVIKTADTPWYEGDLLDAFDKAPFYEIAKKVQEIQNPKKETEDDKEKPEEQSKG